MFEKDIIGFGAMKNEKLIKFLCGALFATVAMFASFAHAEDADELIDKAERAFENMRSMTATFTQTVESKGFGEAQKYRGKMAMLKPNMMLWEYDKPSGRRIVVDGKRLWFYDPDDKTAYFDDLRGALSPNSPALFLAGEATLRQLFKIDLVKPRKKDKLDLLRFRLTPKEPQPGVKAMALVLDGSSFDVVELLMVDHIGNKNRLRFDNVTRSANLDPSQFTFKPPEGVPVRALSGKIIK